VVNLGLYRLQLSCARVEFPGRSVENYIKSPRELIHPSAQQTSRLGRWSLRSIQFLNGVLGVTSDVGIVEEAVKEGRKGAAP
jgi:hypothetical protein